MAAVQQQLTEAQNVNKELLAQIHRLEGDINVPHYFTVSLVAWISCRQKAFGASFVAGHAAFLQQEAWQCANVGSCCDSACWILLRLCQTAVGRDGACHHVALP